MERIKDYLKMLAHDIEDAIHEHGDPEDVEAREEIAEMSEDYNEVYKFYCHHKCLVEGVDPRHAAGASVR